LTADTDDFNADIFMVLQDSDGQFNSLVFVSLPASAIEFKEGIHPFLQNVHVPAGLEIRNLLLDSFVYRAAGDYVWHFGLVMPRTINVVDYVARPFTVIP
jgi:hypothetical protein